MFALLFSIVVEAAILIFGVWCVYKVIVIKFRQKLQTQFRDLFPDYNGNAPWEDNGAELREFLQNEKKRVILRQQEIEKIRMILFLPDVYYRNINWQKKENLICDAICCRQFVKDFNKRVRLAKDMGFDVCKPIF